MEAAAAVEADSGGGIRARRGGVVWVVVVGGGSVFLGSGVGPSIGRGRAVVVRITWNAVVVVGGAATHWSRAPLRHQRSAARPSPYVLCCAAVGAAQRRSRAAEERLASGAFALHARAWCGTLET